MIQLLISLLMTTCVVYGEPASLAWWLLPDSIAELPHEVEEDNNGMWSELWVRPSGNVQVSPTVLIERALGVRWVGLNPDKAGKPTRAVLVLSNKRIADFSGDKVRLGNIDDEKISWSDGAKESLTEFKKRRHRARRSKAARINFGKIALPPIGSGEKVLSEWGVESLAGFLEKIPNGTDLLFTPRDLSAVAQIADSNGSALGFRYAGNCSFDDRQKIENALAHIEPKITCWLEQNKELGARLLASLLQQPLIECKARLPMTADHCAMASMPLVESFFVRQPKLTLALNRCGSELDNTLIHEIFHLAGIKEGPADLDKAIEQSEACESSRATLNFENPGDGFMNDLQVETRIFLFKKVREEAVEKWGWSEGEGAFVLGTICAKMGDKFCARRYFKQASEANLPGVIELPEGGEVPLNSLAHFNYYDSIPEDIYRMHEMVNYLRRDPSGVLLRRLETGTHRLHEFWVARTALESVRNNKGICNNSTDEHIFCEDLAALVMTPWFKGRTP